MSDADPARRCPLCGGPNGCLLAQPGNAGVAACWCRGERFPATLLGRAREADRGRACICRGCLEDARSRGAEDPL